MTSDNRESRFEELRRRARERLEQVREGIEREMGTSAPKSEAPTPDRLEEIYATPERDRPQEVRQEPVSLPPPENRGQDAWEQRVVVPSHRDEEEPAAEASAAPIGPTVTLTSTDHSPKTQPTGRVHRSPAAQLLRKDNLRQAIIAQEVLGKPLSMRSPENDE
jgi:hypothetical protein